MCPQLTKRGPSTHPGTQQNALFALIPGFEDEEEDYATDKDRDKAIERKAKKLDTKLARAGNSMVDTVLRGSGLAGAVVSTIKNVLMEYKKQQGESEFNRENAQILIAALNISPPIGSKIRKIINAFRIMLCFEVKNFRIL